MQTVKCPACGEENPAKFRLCGYCGAPFAGLGGLLVRPLGYRPSRKNPSICATCVELSPPDSHPQT